MNTQHDNRREAQADLDGHHDANMELLRELLNDDMKTAERGLACLLDTPVRRELQHALCAARSIPDERFLSHRFDRLQSAVAAARHEAFARSLLSF
jgi:hypothetical protein